MRTVEDMQVELERWQARCLKAEGELALIKGRQEWMVDHDVSLDGGKNYHKGEEWAFDSLETAMDHATTLDKFGDCLVKINGTYFRYACGPWGPVAKEGE